MDNNGKTTQMLHIKRITGIARAEDVSRSFNKEAVEYNGVSQLNWDNYPYRPEVKFRIAHDGQHIYLNWQVHETDIKAVCDKDGGEIWKDSCVEFFISFKEPVYYNIECNCIGKMLAGTGVDRNNRIPVADKEIGKIKRWASLGDSPIEGQSGRWELSLILPKSLFYLDPIETFDSLSARGNFYKCGDDLRQPHFLSWSAIKSETPNFHLPEYFGKLKFE
jgi:hypothetical protein